MSLTVKAKQTRRDSADDHLLKARRDLLEGDVFHLIAAEAWAMLALHTIRVMKTVELSGRVSRGDTVVLVDQDGQRVEFEVRDKRRGIGVMSAHGDNYVALPSLDGLGGMSASWTDGKAGSHDKEGYVVYSDEGHTLVGDGFLIEQVRAPGCD